MSNDIGKQIDEWFLSISESQEAFERTRLLLGSPMVPEAMRFGIVNSLSTRALRAARAEGNEFSTFDALNAKVKSDWVFVEEAGKVSLTLDGSSAVEAVRMLNGLDILAGTVIAVKIGDDNGLIVSDEGDFINPWKESALVISGLGTGSNWFTLKLKATGRLLKILDGSNIAAGIIVAIVSAFIPFGDPLNGKEKNPPPLPQIEQECDISGEVGDLLDRMKNASLTAAPFTISYECNGKTMTVRVRPEVKTETP